MNKLKYSQVATYRTEQLKEQSQCCALCGEHIYDDAVLDHCHSTGLLRKVLHRGCNALLGKIENNMKRNRMDIHRLEMWANNLVGYINSTHTDILHPTHKTVEERKAATKRRARARIKAKAKK